MRREPGRRWSPSSSVPSRRIRRMRRLSMPSSGTPSSPSSIAASASVVLRNAASSSWTGSQRLRSGRMSGSTRRRCPSEASPREVWRETLRRAWQSMSEHVRVVFDPDSEYGQVFPLQPTLTKVIDTLNAPEIPSDTYAEDEVWGWMYQYYNTEEKDAVYEKLRKSGKLERPDELAAATCLYTERYMVDFLVQNTLGTLWVKMHPETSIFERWPYYIRPVEGGSEQKHVRFPERVRDITLLDPACGSGHFLVRAFDVFAEMYEEEGLEPREEIPYLIL